jgi:hypothetical protein
MGALLDIEESEKLPTPLNFDIKTIKQLKAEINKSFEGGKPSENEPAKKKKKRKNKNKGKDIEEEKIE